MHKLVMLGALILVFFSPAAGIRNRPPVALDDEVSTWRQPQYIDVPVLMNDYDPEGRALTVTGLAWTDLGKAVVLTDGKVRVHPDWSNPAGLVAHGAYIVSDGVLTSEAEWYVWYDPIGSD